MRRLIILAFIIILTANVYGEEKKERSRTISARDAFAKMPMEYLDLIDPSTRLDMLDYFDADSIMQAKNNMYGISRLVSVSPSFLEVKITEVSSYQIKIVRGKDEDYVVAAYTISPDGGVPDSSLFFFDAEMRPMETRRFIRLPGIKDFFSFTKGSDITPAYIQDVIPFPSIVYSLSPDSDTINARITSGGYIDRNEYLRIQKYLNPDGIVFRWNGKQFLPDRKLTR